MIGILEIPGKLRWKSGFGGKMEQAEYWLLNSVLDLKYYLSDLEPEELLESIFNVRRGHGLNHKDLVALLNHLFQSSDLVGYKGLNTAKFEEFVPTEQ